jgi:nitroimidazol reductase NimA-like FMN-containing flavoprotein (pyridoxamine 5'-phosphate oxidase superfamily)
MHSEPVSAEDARRASTPGVELDELGRDECLRLLAGQVIGRVVFTDSAMPAAQPVNYLLSGEEVLFRTANGSKLAAAVRRAVLGFQTDQIDPASATGWSVLGIGQSYEITDPARLDLLERTLPTPWAPGQAVHTIAIPLTRLTGRILRPHPGNEVPQSGPPSGADDATADDTETV